MSSPTFVLRPVSPFISPTTPTSDLTPPPRRKSAKRPKMSLDQTYMVAHFARAKFNKEALHADLNLRLLVGHANLLDCLMLYLANAEQEQESWLNCSVKGATGASDLGDDTLKRTSATVHKSEEAVYDKGSDCESDPEDQDVQWARSVPIRMDRSAQEPQVTTIELASDEETEEDWHEFDLVLTQTPSSHPPELMHEDEDSDSEDGSMPLSPPQTEITFDISLQSGSQSMLTFCYESAPPSIPESEQVFCVDVHNPRIRS